VIAGGQIAVDDPTRSDVRALVERHVEFADGLIDPAITVFSFRAHGTVLGIGALKRLGPHHAEIKSMHTAEAARGRGIGRAILAHLVDVAHTLGVRRVSLETGTTLAFAPARALYEDVGFVECGPFADYQPSEDNLFMTLELAAI
jgi:putative acetyltransferase